MIGSNQVDVVVAWAPDRLHRSPRELEDFIELIEENSVGIETVRAGTWDVSTPHGRLVARMVGAVSRAESEKTGERVKRAHQQAKARGYWRGPIPFGMRATTLPGLPEPDPETCGLVTEIGTRILRGEKRRPREKLTLLGGILRCDEHGHICVGGGDAHSRTYQANGPGMCYVRTIRAPIDEYVKAVIVERLSRPDAAELLAINEPNSDTSEEAADLRTRREELASLVADGLMPASVARPRLEEISAKLTRIETMSNQLVIPPSALVNPKSAWDSWTITEKRDVVRLLFSEITLTHSVKAIGPRVDLNRLTFKWATS